MKLDIDCYTRHNYHNEKVIKWFSENHEVSEDCLEESDGFGCCCLIYMEPEEGVCYLLDSDGNTSDEPYVMYFESIDTEELVNKIPGLTEKEIEELLGIQQLRVYGCPVCKNWSLDE